MYNQLTTHTAVTITVTHTPTPQLHTLLISLTHPRARPLKWGASSAGPLLSRRLAKIEQLTSQFDVGNAAIVGCAEDVVMRNVELQTAKVEQRIKLQCPTSKLLKRCVLYTVSSIYKLKGYTSKCYNNVLLIKILTHNWAIDKPNLVYLYSS